MRLSLCRRPTLALIFALLAACVAAGAVHAGDKTSPPVPLLLQPATGYWYDAERPGTGFALERRDGTLALVFFHFSDVDGQDTRQDDWHLATGTLAYDTFEAPLLHFDGGSCLGCDPFQVADAEQTGTVVRLVFASAREATLQIGDGEARRVVAMPYGVPYETALATPPDLPLPDLRGRWLLSAPSGNDGVFILEERFVADDGVEYRGPAHGLPSANASMRCDADACELWVDALPEFSPAPVMLARFRVADITEERMTGNDDMTFHVRAFRLEEMEDQP